MKKLLVTLLSLPLILAGCTTTSGGNSGSGKTSTDYFKEYTFARVADSDEAEEIKSKVYKEITNISKINGKSEIFEYGGDSTSSIESSYTTTFYLDSNNTSAYISGTEAESTSSSKADGISTRTTNKRSSKSWNINSEYVVSKVTSKINDDKEKINYHANKYDSITGSVQQYLMLQSSKVNSYVKSDSTLYVGKDGLYTYVISSINRTVEPIQYGSGTKEYIQGTKKQTILKLDKSYHITEGYDYSETSSNRDQSTGEFFDKEQILVYQYNYNSYEYGTKSSESITALNESIKGVTIQTSLEMKPEVGTVTTTGSSISGGTVNNDFEQQSSTKTQQDDGSYKITSRVRLDPRYNNYSYIVSYKNPSVRYSISYSYILDGEFHEYNDYVDLVEPTITGGTSTNNYGTLQTYDYVYYYVNNSNYTVYLNLELRVTGNRHEIVSFTLTPSSINI